MVPQTPKQLPTNPRRVQVRIGQDWAQGPVRLSVSPLKCCPRLTLCTKLTSVSLVPCARNRLSGSWPCAQCLRLPGRWNPCAWLGVRGGQAAQGTAGAQGPVPSHSTSLEADSDATQDTGSALETRDVWIPREKTHLFPKYFIVWMHALRVARERLPPCETCAHSSAHAHFWI